MTLAIHGGSRTRGKPFPARQPYGIEEHDAAARVMRSGLLSGFHGSAGPHFNGGPEVQAFERAWAEAYGYGHVITVNSWTAGLIACLKAVGVGPGDEVIVPAWTMSATATAVLFCGARPVFADVESVTYGVDYASVLDGLTERTRAVMAVHLFGQPAANMAALRYVALNAGAALIEDCAQSPGVRYEGEYVGAIGTIGGFSLTQTKHIHTGEGGVIVTNDDRLAEYCRRFRNHGENVSETWGGNFRLTELQAAIGSAQLPKLPGILAHRQWLAAHLTWRLRDVPGITPPLTRHGSEHAYFTYAMRFDSTVFGCSRRQFVEAVNAELGDDVLVEGYVEPLHRNPVYGANKYPLPLPVVERLQDSELVRCRMVREPLTEGDMDDIADAMLKVAAHVDTLATGAA
jgi:dTDP-4-amino-4,6-dideoxygalactose transaminase